MGHPQERELMLKFLERHYPVKRIKHDQRFKRTIINEYGEKFYLSDRFMSNLLYKKLLETLRILFDADEKLNNDVLKTFLRLR